MMHDKSLFLLPEIPRGEARQRRGAEPPATSTTQVGEITGAPK